MVLNKWCLQAENAELKGQVPNEPSEPASVLNINKKCPAVIYSSSLCHGLLYSPSSYSRRF